MQPYTCLYAYLRVWFSMWMAACIFAWMDGCMYFHMHVWITMWMLAFVLHTLRQNQKFHDSMIAHLLKKFYSDPVCACNHACSGPYIQSSMLAKLHTAVHTHKNTKIQFTTYYSLHRKMHTSHLTYVQHYYSTSYLLLLPTWKDLVLQQHQMIWWTI